MGYRLKIRRAKYVGKYHGDSLIEHDFDYDAFTDELNQHDSPPEIRTTVHELQERNSTEVHCKLRADTLSTWLMTFDSWTEDYCPIRLKLLKD